MVAPRCADAGSGVATETGTLRLVTLNTGVGCTRVSQQFHRGALRILRAHPTAERTTITVVNPGGGYLSGDRYLLEYHGGVDTRALLTTQSATKVYRNTGEPARSEQRFSLDSGAVLENVPDQLIAYAQARYEQDTVIELADASAGYFGAEIITPGWSPDGESFRYEQVRLRTRLSIAGTPLLYENLLLTPSEQAIDDPAWLGTQSHCASVVIAGAGVDERLLGEIRTLCADTEPQILSGCGLLAGPGVVVRALGTDTGRLRALVDDLGRLYQRARGLPGTGWDLRKY